MYSILNGIDQSSEIDLLARGIGAGLWRQPINELEKMPRLTWVRRGEERLSPREKKQQDTASGELKRV